MRDGEGVSISAHLASIMGSRVPAMPFHYYQRSASSYQSAFPAAELPLPSSSINSDCVLIVTSVLVYRHGVLRVFTLSKIISEV